MGILKRIYMFQKRSWICEPLVLFKNFFCSVIVQLWDFKDDIQIMPKTYVRYLFALQIGNTLANQLTSHVPAFQDKTGHDQYLLLAYLFSLVYLSILGIKYQLTYFL